jgi:hypothetical protein
LTKDEQGLVLRTEIGLIKRDLSDWVTVVPVGEDPSKPVCRYTNPQDKSYGCDDDITRVKVSNKKDGTTVGGKQKLFAPLQGCCQEF